MLDEHFRRGEFNTNYIDQKIDELVYQDEHDPKDLVLAISAAIVAHSGL